MRTILRLAILSSLCAAAPARAAAPPKLERGELSFQDRTRTYLAYVPPGDGPFPLVIALHGRLGDGKGQERLTSLGAVAAREGFAVVFPDGIHRSWADARGVTPASKEGVDDLGFLGALVDDFVAHHHVDATRVYATGMSNGAMMALTLACRMSDKIAGVFAVAGELPDGRECKPARPISVAVVMGSKDPLVPVEGGPMRDRGSVLSLDQTLEVLRQADGCTVAIPEVALPDNDPHDGTTTHVSGWAKCDANVTVRRYLVEGGGHTWPGGWQYLSERLIGRSSRDFSASDEAWRFLREHTLSPPRPPAPPKVEAPKPKKPRASHEY